MLTTVANSVGWYAWNTTNMAPWKIFFYTLPDYLPEALYGTLR